jgi:hypothetical protein
MTLSEKVILIDPPAPHSKKQKFLFSCLLQPNIREVWCCSGTKFGKTLGATVAQINRALAKPRSKNRWVAPIYSQTLQAVEYFDNILPRPPHSKKDKAANMIHLPYAQTRFEFWHSSHPPSLEGEGIDSYVFDEAAKQPKEIRTSARTTTTKTKGPMLFISYPFGKNWFYDGCMDAQEHMHWAIKNNKPIEKVFFHARTEDNPTIDKQVIANAKKELPARLFRQFYLAEFIDDGTVISNVRACVFGEPLDLFGEIQKWIISDAKESTVVIGVDWAKTVDFTVFIAMDTKLKKVVGLCRFHKTSYTEQVRILAFFAKQFKSVEMIIHDKTGVGQALDDQLAYINQPYHGVTLTNALKNEFITNMITNFEQEYISIPNWREMVMELEAYELKPTATGLPSYSAPMGKHDDIVCALFLANYGLQVYGDREMNVVWLEDLPKNAHLGQNELERYYNDMDEDIF